MKAETAILHMLKYKHSYTTIRPHIKEHSISREGWLIIQAIDSYYKTYSKTEIDWDDLESYFFLLKHKHLSEDRSIISRTIFNNIREYDKELLSSKEVPPIIEDVISDLIQLDYASKIVEEGLNIANSKYGASLDNIASLVSDWEKTSTKISEKKSVFVEVDASVLKEAVSSDGFEWRLHELNCSLGPLRLGDFVIVGARPETGKTTFAAQEATYMATQIKDERPIIWVNNEERSRKVMLRCIQSYFGITNKVLYDDLETWINKYKTIIGNKILLTDDDESYNNVKSLDKLFEEYNPCLIIFDQLDKVESYSYTATKAERDDLRLGHLYKWARNLAKKYGPVIALSQVGGSGEGERWIYKHQLRGTTTDKQGEADAIVTIGMDNDPSLEYSRFIHVPKNKLFGGKYSQESLRHGYFEVTIDPSIGRYKGTMKK